MIVVPPEFAARHIARAGEAGRYWIDALPALADRYLRDWDLRPDGAPMHGYAGLVLPVVRADGQPAALKLPIISDEHRGEAAALRTWDGDGAVRLLDDDPETWVLLLERLDGRRDLRSMPDDREALAVICGLLRRLHAHPAPAGIPRLADVAAGLVAHAPDRAAAASPEHARRMLAWAAVTAEVATEPGDRLLHWDLHYENALSATREPWLAIDPKPLVGDPGFDLWPALSNRWGDAVATGDVRRAVRRRFDLMVDELGLDRDRAIAWTRARMLQNAIWNAEDGVTDVIDDIAAEIDLALG
ncbi:MAG TPA: aminoglycoside phosphotransferase family protein [Micromonosporaceae bacterium]